jgi:hypothetical protein
MGGDIGLIHRGRRGYSEGTRELEKWPGRWEARKNRSGEGCGGRGAEECRDKRSFFGGALTYSKEMCLRGNGVSLHFSPHQLHP